MDTLTAQALVRFGLGRRGEEALPADPRGWLAGQVRGPDRAAPTPAPSTAEGLAALRDDREQKPPPGQSKVRALYQAQARALLETALTTPAPFRERLVWFWANHFTVSLRHGGCAAVAGAFVAEAIRPHVTGRFDDMLLAVMRHPAMLIYLDNAESVGPDSLAGRRRNRGLNENLARECLELHTVSPAARYTQADVTEFAKVLTGWSIEMKEDPAGYRFRPGAHQPGPKTVMGRVYPQGEEGGLMVLAFLAAHPATHRHLATKLVRHFVADDPPPDAVRKIEGVLRDTRGDLGAASLALIALPGAWAGPTKLRTPQDYALAVLRATDLPPDKRPDPLGALGGLGQPLFTAPLPNGWSDVAADWAAPEAMMRRVDWAYGLAGRCQSIDPERLAETALGPAVQPATLMQMRHAGSRRDALTLLLTAPEFQRR
jgi:uncharacterized protein (DUF1800 family)